MVLLISIEFPCDRTEMSTFEDKNLFVVFFLPEIHDFEEYLCPKMRQNGAASGLVDLYRASM